MTDHDNDDDDDGGDDDDRWLPPLPSAADLISVAMATPMTCSGLKRGWVTVFIWGPVMTDNDDEGDDDVNDQ